MNADLSISIKRLSSILGHTPPLFASFTFHPSTLYLSLSQPSFPAIFRMSSYHLVGLVEYGSFHMYFVILSSFTVFVRIDVVFSLSYLLICIYFCYIIYCLIFRMLSTLILFIFVTWLFAFLFLSYDLACLRQFRSCLLILIPLLFQLSCLKISSCTMVNNYGDTESPCLIPRHIDIFLVLVCSLSDSCRVSLLLPTIGCQMPC